MNQKTAHRRFSISSFPQAFKNQSMTSYAEDEQGEPDEDLTESLPFMNMMNSLKALNEQMEELAVKDEQFQSDNGNFEFHDLTPGEQDRIMREQRQMLPLDFDTDTLYYKMGVIGGMAGGQLYKKGDKKVAGPLGRGWSKRWMRLNLYPGHDEQGRALPPIVEYFNGQPNESKKARGHISLHAKTSVHMESVRQIKKKKIQNMTPFFVEAFDKQGQMRKFELAAEDRDHAIAWVDSLQFVVAGLRRHAELLEQYQMGNFRPGMLQDEETDEETRLAREDEAQSIEATGSGLYESVIGNPSYFQIEVIDPVTKEPRSEHECYEMAERFAINLQSIDEDEETDEKAFARDDDGVGGDQKKKDEELSRHLHYDLRAEYLGDESGMFECSYTVSRVGKYRLSIMLGDYPIYGSPFTMVAVPGSVHAKCCKAEGYGVQLANWEELNTVTVKTYDRLNTPLTKGGLAEKFLITFDEDNADSPASLTDLVTDNGDGSYTFQYRIDQNKLTGQRSVSIEIKIDDGSAFGEDTLEKVRMNNSDHYEKYDDLPVERPAWPINIRGSPFMVPITNVRPGIPGKRVAQSMAAPSSIRSPEHLEVEMRLAEKEKFLAEEQERLAKMRLELERKGAFSPQRPEDSMPPPAAPSAMGEMVQPLMTPVIGARKQNSPSFEQVEPAEKVGAQSPGNFGGRQADEIRRLFDQYAEPLGQVFDFYSQDQRIIGLSNFIQLGIDFDLYPTFVDKAEMRSCFQEAQLKFTSQSDTLSYDGFIDALYLLAVVSLSKKTFSNLYPTDAEKVNVLLGLWGLGDPLKLEQIKGKHRGL